MITLQKYFFKQNWSPYEPEQRRRILSIVIWCTLAAGMLMGAVNLVMGDWRGALILFAMSLTCVAALILNHYGKYTPASVIISAMVILTAGYNLVSANGIRDPGVVAYPILVIFGSLLFGKRAAPVFGLAGILSVVGTAYLSMIGAIKAVGDRTTPVDAAIISILITVSAVLSWAVMDTLENNLERIKKDEANLRVTYDITLDGWARALDYRDRITEGHSRRVVEMCVRLAKELGCSDEELAHVRRGALLHDIGKMAIPDQILFKPGPLDEEEWEVMKRHPELAREMLADIPFLQPAIAIPYCHHECWDGGGYPQGLKEAEIPLIARLFTVVDKFDALISDRPYRPAWTPEKAVSYLEENTGKIFDPGIVPVFLHMLAEDTFKFGRPPGCKGAKASIFVADHAESPGED
ncbi:MAG TPA: HD-GYP domain-containing protein [Anaerolineales bacterium]|nr:HD-GYP domain-containing protein [Anaerolineales bacterium]